MDQPSLPAARYKFEQVLSAKLSPAELAALKVMLLTRAFEELVIPVLRPGQATILIPEPWRTVRHLDSEFDWLQGGIGVALMAYDVDEIHTREPGTPMTREEFAATWGLQAFTTRDQAITMATGLHVTDHEIWVVYFTGRKLYALMVRDAVEQMVARGLLGPENVVWTPPNAAPWAPLRNRLPDDPA